MTVNEITNYCLQKKSSYIDYPFGYIPICIKIQNKIFIQIYPNQNDCKITLKCEPLTGDFYRQKYPNIIVRGYHCPPVQQPYWNTVFLNGVIPDEELKVMIDHAYDYVVSKSIKKEREKIMK